MPVIAAFFLIMLSIVTTPQGVSAAPASESAPYSASKATLKTIPLKTGEIKKISLVQSWKTNAAEDRVRNEALIDISVHAIKNPTYGAVIIALSAFVVDTLLTTAQEDGNGVGKKELEVEVPKN